LACVYSNSTEKISLGEFLMKIITLRGSLKYQKEMMIIARV